MIAPEHQVLESAHRMRPMPTRARAFILMFLLLWQSLTALAAVRVDEQAEVLAHALVHSQATDHHHHMDDSLHLDDVDTPDVHQHVHDGLQVHAVPLAPWLHLTAVAPSSPPGLAQAQRPPVFLEGPLRPPQTRA